MQNIQVHYSNSSSPKGEAGLLSRPELEQMITWETNNLYEYLKDLYDRQHADLADYNRSAALHHTVASNKLLMSLLVLPIWAVLGMYSSVHTVVCFASESVFTSCLKWYVVLLCQRWTEVTSVLAVSSSGSACPNTMSCLKSSKAKTISWLISLRSRKIR